MLYKIIYINFFIFHKILTKGIKIVKKFKKIIFFSLILCVFVFSCVVNINSIKVLAESGNIFASVLGYGKCEASCDQMEINFCLQNACESFALCQENNNKIIDELTAKVKEIDSGANLVIKYSSCYPAMNASVASYFYSVDLCISSSCLDCVDKFVEILGDYSNISYYGITYQLKNKTECYNNALMLAKEDAKQKAKSLYQNASLVDLFEVDILTSCDCYEPYKLCIEARVRAKFVVENEIENADKINQEKNYIVTEK